MRWKRRIAKLKAKRGSKFTGFRQTDGSVKYIRTDQLGEVCTDAMKGRDTPATRALLCADSATDGGHLHQLVQALHSPAYVSPRPIVEVIQ